MLTTEEEAKKKWCSEALSTEPNMASFNRDENGNPSKRCRCLASGCMKWRWALIMDPGRSSTEDRTRGYCGLAGNPQGVS